MAMRFNEITAPNAASQLGLYIGSPRCGIGGFCRSADAHAVDRTPDPG
jgi:hypothetical protein